MKAAVVLVTLVLAQSVSWAQSNCKKPTLRDFTVFSASDINVQNSDYQGLAGAGGKITARNFQFNSNPAVCLAIAARNDVSISASAIQGNLESNGNVTLENVGASGNVYGVSADIYSSKIKGSLATYNKPSVGNSGIGVRKSWNAKSSTNYDAVINEMNSDSRAYASESATTASVLSGDTLSIELTPGRNVVNLSSQDLEVGHKMIITGDGATQLIINVSGQKINLRDLDVELPFDALTLPMTWNFYQAEFLHISHTANSQYGMPGVIFAPSAMVEFNEGLITGALYAGMIVANTTADGGLNAGQINRGHQGTVIVKPPKAD